MLVMDYVGLGTKPPLPHLFPRYRNSFMKNHKDFELRGFCNHLGERHSFLDQVRILSFQIHRKLGV